MFCMDKKIIKRGYNFTEELIKEWERFHRPSKDFSPSAAGALLVWMSLPSEFREEIRQLAHEPQVRKNIAVVKEKLKKAFIDEALLEELENSDSVKKNLLAALEKMR